MGDARFSVGVNLSVPWRAFDAGAISDAFARIAALGLDTVRFALSWGDFQPQPDAIDPIMLARFETVVGLAADARLHTIPVLVDRLPAWAHGSLYAGALLDAQLRLARAVGERVRPHSAVRAWDIAHAFSSLSEPEHRKTSTGDHGAASAAEPVLADWSRRLAAALRETSMLPATVSAQAADFTSERDVRLTLLCAPLAFASLAAQHVDTSFAREPLDAEAIPFLAMLAAGFSYKPVLVSAFAADAPVSAEERAAYCYAVLERLHADGRLGALWWSWDDCRDTPIAAALAAFARQQRTVVKARDMTTIASTYYYRTLPSSTRTLFEAYLGFVADRRGIV